jgi:hypothetical protein
MTLNEVKALKVGDLIRYHDSLSNMETLEIVMSEWGQQGHNEMHTPNVTLQTVAVMNEGWRDEWDEPAKVGDEGWINEYNYGCFERLA